MYRFYHTPGFVLSAQDISEGSRMLSLFTRELGLVRVHARSLREERSRLRGFLQPLSFAQVALIRGRDMWRLTTAGPDTNFIETLSEKEKNTINKVGVRAGVGDGALDLPLSHQRSLSHVAHTLERHLQGEESDELLYDAFRDGLQYLSQCPTEHLGSWESLMLARLLSQLGYGHIEYIDPQLAQNVWNEEVLVASAVHARELEGLVQRALLASQL